MTTDAKIGLLLGLVFIVIIAFVINGLPSFNKGSSSTDPTKDYVTAIGNGPVGLPSQRVDIANNDTNAASSPNAVATSKSPITQVNAPIETSIPTKEAVMAVGPEKSVEEALAPSEPVVTSTTAEIIPTSTTASEQKSTVYVVKKGDNLGLIAQNCYGTQGSKKENVTKIVKANHLKSEKQIYIGQKLVIPNPTTLSDSKPSMFEKVKDMGKSLSSSIAAKDTTPAEKGLRDYVVKSGDYPWKIAKKELGDGNRYKDILKCNPNITEKTTLSIGMHLKLPPR